MRKVALGVSLLTFAAPTVSLGLGLGDIQVESALNQPLKAQIQVLSVPPRELEGVKVRLAPRDAFARVGIERVSVLGELRFSVSTGSNGQAVINVTSTRPVREPFLDFLVQVEWPKGQLLREYTILLDPPVVMNQPATSAIQAPVAGRGPVSGAGTRLPARNAVSAAPSAEGVTPRGPQQGGVETDFGRSWGAAGAADGGQSVRYRVRRGDTLGDIAQEYRPDPGATLQQTMLAFLRKNPEAFNQGNVNNLKAGYILRVPERSEVLGIGRAEAAAELSRQTALWRAYRQQLGQRLAQPGRGGDEVPAAGGVAGATQAAADTAVGATLPEEAQDLEIMGAGTAKEGQGAASGDDPEVREQLALTQELIETQRQENAELHARVADLEKMLAQQDRIINLQSTQLAELQAVLTQGEAGAVPQEGVEGPSPEAEEGPAQTAEMPVAGAPPEVVSSEGAVPVTAPPPEAEEGPAQTAEMPVAGAPPEAVSSEGAVPVTAPPLEVAVAPEEQGAGMSPDATGPAEALSAEADSGQVMSEVVDADQLIDEAFADMEGMDDAWAGELAAEDPGSELEVPTPPAAAVTPVEAGQPAGEVAESAAVPPVWAGFIDEVLANPMALAAMGGTGALALVLLGLVVARSRKGAADEAPSGDEAIDEALAAIEGEEAVSAAVEDAEEAVAGEQAASSETEAETDEAVAAVAEERPGEETSTDKAGDDVIAEADVYIAYGMYGQAEELLKQALDEHPEAAEYRAKLLEAHYGAKDPEAFDAEASSLHGQGPDPEQWARVAAMGRELNPQNPLYQEGAAGQAVAEKTPMMAATALGAGEAAGAAAMETLVSEGEAPATDSDSIHVPELAPDVVAETAVESPDPELEDSLLTPASEEDDSETLLEFDVEDLDIGMDDVEGAASDEAEAEVDSTSLDFDLSDLSDLDIEVPEGESGVAEADAEDDALEIDLDVDERDEEADLAGLSELVVDEEVSELTAAPVDPLATSGSDDEPQPSPDALGVRDEAQEDPDRQPADIEPETLVVETEGMVEALEEDMAPTELSASPAEGQAEEDDAAFLDELLGEDLGIDELDEDALLSTDDEVGTKLDLAKAYMDMGDQEGARSTLEEVMQEGDDTQRKEAEGLLRQIA